jgi:hypothetical protein
VLAAVELDCKPSFVAGEVCEVGADRRLPAKVRSVDAGGAEALPQDSFGVGPVAAQAAGALGSTV